MTETIVLIEPHDPVIFRDGKPFSDGLPAKSLPFPLPGTTAGAIRTRSAENLNFDDERVLDALVQIRQVGPFPAAFDERSGKWILLLPAPADAVPYARAQGGVEYERLRPSTDGLSAGGGCDLPEGMQPLVGSRPEKVCEAPPLWTAVQMSEWLQRTEANWVPKHTGFGRLPLQRRIHVAIGEESQTAADGMLFSTDGLEFAWPQPNLGIGDDLTHLPARRAAIVSKIHSPGALAIPDVAPLGGERRLAMWSKADAGAVEWPKPPAWLNSAKDGRIIRVVLATPGAFRGGWRPEWCDGEKEHPEIPGLKLKLVAAAVPRFQPVSGWDFRKGRRGPKATRFLAPAGSVYFFRVTAGAAELPRLWMQSICDDEQDVRDGYGIALVGDC